MLPLPLRLPPGKLSSSARDRVSDPTTLLGAHSGHGGCPAPLPSCDDPARLGYCQMSLGDKITSSGESPGELLTLQPHNLAHFSFFSLLHLYKTHRQNSASPLLLPLMSESGSFTEGKGRVSDKIQDSS